MNNIDIRQQVYIMYLCILQYICISAASCHDNSCERFFNVPQTDYLALSLFITHF